MLKSDLLKLILEFSRVSGETIPIIAGSQSTHAITDHPPEIARKSVECDFILSPGNFGKRAEIDERLGVFSAFQIANGFYADALGLATVVLPDGWRDRLVPLLDDAGNEIAHCLEIHDLGVSKVVAGRDKDLDFLESALASELIDIEQLLDRLQLVKSKVENDTLTGRLGRLSVRLQQAKIHGAAIEAIKAFS